MVCGCGLHLTLVGGVLQSDGISFLPSTCIQYLPLVPVPVSCVPRGASNHISIFNAHVAAVPLLTSTAGDRGVFLGEGTPHTECRLLVLLLLVSGVFRGHM